MRTFEYHDDKSHRFWSIELRGDSFEVTFGRVGTLGQQLVMPFADASSAQKAHDKAIRQKLRQGYLEKECPAPTPASPPSPTLQALEQAVLENPDDLAAHHAYADCLMEHNDPRGEFIQVQLALEDPARKGPGRKQLQKREKELLRKHQREWLGAEAEFLLDAYTPMFRFARGWLDGLTLNLARTAQVQSMAAAPQLRLLRELTLGGEAYHFWDVDYPSEPADEHQALRTLFESPYLSNVRIVRLGEVAVDRYLECDSEASAYSYREALLDPEQGNWKRLARLPRLEELYFYGNTSSIEALFRSRDLKRLRVLQVYHGDHFPLQALANNKSLHSLTHLALRPCALEEDEAVLLRLADVRPVFTSPNLPALTHLRLQQSDLGDAGCAEIVQSGLLRRLKVLDLARGGITIEGARTLAACPELKHLKMLDLSHNALSRAAIRLLEKTGVPLRAEFQHGVDETYYLYEGQVE